MVSPTCGYEGSLQTELNTSLKSSSCVGSNRQFRPDGFSFTLKIRKLYQTLRINENRADYDETSVRRPTEKCNWNASFRRHWQPSSLNIKAQMVQYDQYELMPVWSFHAGINNMCANLELHRDPWWNPHRKIRHTSNVDPLISKSIMSAQTERQQNIHTSTVMLRYSWLWQMNCLH